MFVRSTRLKKKSSIVKGNSRRSTLRSADEPWSFVVALALFIKPQ
jgi:hypothetical protein